MFGVLCITHGGREGAAARLLGRLQPKRRIGLEERRVGMSVYIICTVTLPEDVSEEAQGRRIGYALDMLRKRGIRRMVMPEEYRAMAEACQMAVVDGGQALAACIPQGVAAWSAEQEVPLSRLCLRFKGRRVNRTVAAGILAVAPHVRAIHLDFQVGSAPLERRLLAEYGIAARGAAPRDSIAVTLQLEGCEAASGTTLDLTGERMPDTWQPELVCQEASIPLGIDGNAFITALYLDGGMDFTALDIRWRYRQGAYIRPLRE